jgi:enoyl-CoA hydratase
MNDLVLVERDGPIATVVLNRADKLNALTKPMWQGWARRCAALSADDACAASCCAAPAKRRSRPATTSPSSPDRALEQGAGDRLRPHHARDRAGARRLPPPDVAQIHGICVGGGLEIARSATCASAAPSSRFGAPIKNLGLVMAYAEMAPLVRLVGAASRSRSCSKAASSTRRGEGQRLVTRVVPTIRWPPRRAPPRSASPTARRWWRAGTRSSRAAGRPAAAHRCRARRACFDCFDTEDFRIGYQAFLAKTKPQFVGR